MSVLQPCLCTSILYSNRKSVRQSSKSLIWQNLLTCLPITVINSIIFIKARKVHVHLRLNTKITHRITRLEDDHNGAYLILYALNEATPGERDHW